jgi:DNA-binding GntR family transcriptional regulator
MILDALPVSPSLSELAYKVIKEAILSLKIRPGAVLSIGYLADRLEVSRTPVRDAVLWLERDGLVTLIPHKGVRVLEISAKDIEKMYELRILLESYAAKVATTQLSPDELERLDKVLYETQEAFGQGQRVLASDVGRQIHDLLVQKVDNKWLTTVLDDLDTHYTRIRRFSALIPGRFERSHLEHREILMALQSRDAQKAEQAMVDHLTSVEKDILSNIDIWMTYLEGEEEGLPSLDQLLNPATD